MAFTKRKIAQVEIEGIDAPIYVKELNARGFAAVADAIGGIEGKPQSEQAKAMAFVACMSCCDADGALLYASGDEVLEESFAFLAAVCEAAMDINGLADEGDADPKG